MAAPYGLAPSAAVDAKWSGRSRRRRLGVRGARAFGLQAQPLAVRVVPGRELVLGLVTLLERGHRQARLHQLTREERAREHRPPEAADRPRAIVAGQPVRPDRLGQVGEFARQHDRAALELL